MMKTMITACLALLALSAIGGTFETKDHFTIQLPQDWVRVPDDVLVSLEEAIAQLSPDTPVQTYDYGFQLNTSGEWFSYPCILVQVNYEGRYSTGELERFAEHSSGAEAMLDEDKTLLTQVREQEGVKVLVARQLTEHGFIELSGYASTDTFDEFEPLFMEAFSNLKLDDVVRYKPQITDNAPVVGSINLGKVMMVCVQAAFIGGGLWAVYALLRRKLKRA